MRPLVLASGSPTRAALLRAAGLAFEVVPARIDEEALTAALRADGAPPRDLADALAEAKARRVAARRADALVIGSDQVLEVDGAVLDPPASREAAVRRLGDLSAREHRLISAAVAHEDGRPVWRHVETVRIVMRAPSEAWTSSYIERHWDAVAGSPGAYALEGEGARMVARIDGDWFAALGLPLLPLLGWLIDRGTVPG